MYSDKLDEDYSRASQKVDYYKKVEKTITKTVIKDGSKPSTQKVVSTTIIKDGNNPEQVSKKIYSSKNYGGSQILQNSQKYGNSGKYKPGGSSQISQSIVKSSYSKYNTGTKPSSQTINISSKYNSKTTDQISKKAISSTNTHIANKVKDLDQKYGAGVVKSTRSLSSGNKEKFTYAGTVKEKQNYVYYVSGIGYVTKDGAEKAKQERPKSKPVPQPILRNERNVIKIITKRKERTGEKVENYEYQESKDIRDRNRDTIVIHRRLGDPYYQLIGDRKRFSSYTSGTRGYKSNYSLGNKDYGIDSLSKGKSNTLQIENKYRNKTESKRGTILTGKYKSSSSTNKYQTNTQSISSAKESQSTLNNKNYGRSKYNSKYQKNVHIEESRKKYAPKGKYEKSYTEGNRGGKSSRFSMEKYKKIETNYTSNIGGSIDKKKNLPPSSKKYEEKTDDTYKKGKRPYNQNLNQKVYDTEKYKRGTDNTNKYKKPADDKSKKGGYIPKYQPKGGDLNKRDSSMDKYKKGGNADKSPYGSNQKDSLSGEKDLKEVNASDRYPPQGVLSGEKGGDGYGLTGQIYLGELNAPDRFDGNSCPIHGQNDQGYPGKEGEDQGRFGQQGRREENRYEYIHEQVNNCQGEEDEPDNYKFYESKNVTRKVENINTMNMQNMMNSETNLNTLNVRNMLGQENLMSTGMGMGVNQQMQDMSQQMQRISQQSQGMSLMNQQGLMGMQGMRESGSQGFEAAKLYIATNSIPVYSELVNQRFTNINSSNVCNVCGNPFDQGLINNEQGIVYSNNGCPIHGQTMIQQQQFTGY